MDELNVNLPTGYVLDQYGIEAVLGTGGFGITYKAFDNQLRQSVAIKEYLPAEMAGRSTDNVTVQPRKNSSSQFRFGLDKFLDEARTLARFRHPNIVRVTRFLETNGTAYLVMDYVEGESLSDYLNRTRTPVTENQIKAWFIPILQGLVTVHDAGFLHRDIKPGNIYLRDNGEPVLIDFGAARQALGEQSNSVTGIFTAGYAPTEQYGSEGKKQGPWTDLYSVGATLYRCISGQTPVDAPTRQSALVEGDADPLVPAREVGAGRYSPALLQLIDELLVLPIKDRPQSAAPVLAALAAGTSLFAQPTDNGALVGGATKEAQTVLGSAQPRTSVTPQPMTAMSARAMSGGGDGPPAKGSNVKVVAGIAGLLIVCLLAALFVLVQRHNADVERQNAELAAEQLRQAEVAQAQAVEKAAADAKALAEAKAEEAARVLAQAQAEEAAKALAAAQAEEEAAQAQAEEKAQALAAAQAKAEMRVASASQAQARAEPANQAQDEMAAMQAQLNAQVMAQPFNPGDIETIDAYIKDAMENDIKPVGRAPSYWQPGYTCDYIRQYRYDYNTYRNCLYHYRYYGSYW